MGAEIKISFLFGVIVYTIWFLSLIKLYSAFFQRKNNTVWKYIGIFCLLIIMGIWTTDNYLIYSVTQQALLILSLFITFHGDKWEKLGLSSVLVSVWEFVSNGSEAVLSVCNMILSNNRYMPYDRGNGYLIGVLSCLITASFLSVLFGKTKLSEGNFLHGSGKILFPSMGLLLILIDVCNYGITQGVIMVANNNGAEYWNTAYNEFFTHIEVFILSLLCMIISFSLLFGINRLIEYTTVDNLRKLEISHYKMILEQYQEQTNVRHDMKNHLISLSAFAENEEWTKLKEYLAKIYNVGMIGEQDIETGNSVVNAIVNNKKLIAKQKGIKFDCDINIPKMIDIEEYDLCIIWGNILDNAMEAADIAENERYIYVQAEIVKKNLIINIKNSIKLDMLSEKFGMQNWGIGLRNVNKIVQKENGIMDIEIKGTVFEISIMLPVISYP